MLPFKKSTALILGCVLALTSTNVLAQSASQQCAERKEVVRFLGEKFHENPVSFGVTENGMLLEVFTTAYGSGEATWTIIMSMPNGISCLVASGNNWSLDHPEKNKPLGKGS